MVLWMGFFCMNSQKRTAEKNKERTMMRNFDKTLLFADVASFDS